MVSKTIIPGSNPGIPAMISPLGSIPIIFGGLIIFGIIIVVIAELFHSVFYARRLLMTPGELRFYQVLRTVTEPSQTIFSQVRLASLVQTRGPFEWRNFSPLAIRSVDFVIFDIHKGTTLLVIELDDKTHRFSKRRFRDRFIDSALASADIPILHLPYQIHYDQASLHSAIQAVISGKPV